MGNLFKVILTVSFVLLSLVSCGARQEVRKVLSAFMDTEIVLPGDMEVYEDGTFSLAVMDSLRPVKMII